MLTLPPSVRIYLAAAPVDMRRGHDGLAAIVCNQWKLDLYGGHLFVFVGCKRDRCKVLFFDRGGFVLYYKRAYSGGSGRSFRRDLGSDSGGSGRFRSVATLGPDRSEATSGIRQ